MGSTRPDRVDPGVVPHVGTWIEIGALMRRRTLAGVVPHVGTWIEIAPPVYREMTAWSCLT